MATESCLSSSQINKVDNEKLVNAVFFWVFKCVLMPWNDLFIVTSLGKTKVAVKKAVRGCRCR